jgi:hypothetical protein
MKFVMKNVHETKIARYTLVIKTWKYDLKILEINKDLLKNYVSFFFELKWMTIVGFKVSDVVLVWN